MIFLEKVIASSPKNGSRNQNVLKCGQFSLFWQNHGTQCSNWQKKTSFGGGGSLVGVPAWVKTEKKIWYIPATCILDECLCLLCRNLVWHFLSVTLNCKTASITQRQMSNSNDILLSLLGSLWIWISSEQRVICFDFAKYNPRCECQEWCIQQRNILSAEFIHRWPTLSKKPEIFPQEGNKCIRFISPHPQHITMCTFWHCVERKRLLLIFFQSPVLKYCKLLIDRSWCPLRWEKTHLSYFRASCHAIFALM